MRLAGWIDASERRLVTRVLAERRRPDVLDVGVGGGLTKPLLRPSSGRYVAIDFLPAMVQASQSRFPESDVRLGDARRLAFDDASFDVVLFSINGLDAVGHDDRLMAIAEIRRVLREGGQLIFFYSQRGRPGTTGAPLGTSTTLRRQTSLVGSHPRPPNGSRPLRCAQLPSPSGTAQQRFGLDRHHQRRPRLRDSSPLHEAVHHGG